VLQALPIFDKKILLIDIGGALNSSSANREMIEANSLSWVRFG
jgi:hypothetical protein